MTFDWPWALTSLLAVPLLVLFYQRLLTRRAARRSQLAAMGLIAPAALSRGWRRHVPVALLLAAVTLLLVALARPNATVPRARREGTVILAFDVSASMAAKDLEPTRMAAAKAAAKAFVDRQPGAVRIGVVAFSGSGVVTQEATTERAPVRQAIDRLAPDGATALARGLQTALSAITGKPVQLADPSESIEAEGQDLDYHGSAAVVLLSDGENTDEADPISVAELASSAGVRVYPIGLGSPQGTVLEIDGFQVATSLDEPMLRAIADTTDARYFAAADEDELADVYRSIDLDWKVESEHVEITAVLGAAAGLLVLLAAVLSLLWFGRAV
ncbi:MAG TPA: VWA domain-containing protein [Mycobacteriales bacterium]|jgi:Ca-activated chloride channel family protein|nr:VWA domain-containing protein [Mycobacteriales bacterium]